MKIRLKFITTMPEPNKWDSLRFNYPGEAMQLFQLVHYWATNYGVVLEPFEISEDGYTKTDSFLIPNRDTRDQILAHANSNGVLINTHIFEKMREHIESFGGTLVQVEEEVPD
jgi:hypothetical protein